MKELIINGVDLSELCPEFGVEVNYKKVKGKAGGTMLDGSEIEDVIKNRAVITVSFLPWDEETQSAFLKKLYASRYAMVKYFDPVENEYREIEAIYSEPKTKFRFRDIHERDIWILSPMTFTQRN